MFPLLVVAAVLWGVEVNAQYENPYLKPYTNPYAIQPIRPIQPLRPIQTFRNPYSNLFPNRTSTTTSHQFSSNPYKNSYSSVASSYSTINPALVISPTGEYLGNTASDRYDPESINNPYGLYGSRYSPESVNNPYGRFGSQYSPESANNPYATDTPHLYGQQNTDYRGKLSANHYDSQSVENKYSIHYDKPLATQRQLLRKQLIESYSNNPDGFLKVYRDLTTSQRKAVLQLLTEE